MNVLILGSGGREHALAWKINQSHHCTQLFVAPGNPGIASIATCVSMGYHDFEAIKNFCVKMSIDVLVVGPEEPLVNGITDFMEDAKAKSGWKGFVVGPTKAAAQLEGSKAFSKRFMQRYGIPTAHYAEFTADNYAEAQAYIAQHTLPIVLKADGLAAGKGVVICSTHKEALECLNKMLLEQQFGAASSKVVIEEFLDGIEVSVFALTNGIDYQIIGHAKDYKRIGEGDTGLNTGGMGCVSPVPFMDDAFMEKINLEIVRPTINGIKTEGLVYNGFLFFGLINCNGLPKVIEYNCRMGDPETEVVLPMLETDLLSLFAAMDNGTLADANINFSSESFATIVAVSGGYPEEYKKGITINGIEQAAGIDNVEVFHAGTKYDDSGKIVTNGGRVLAITGKATNLPKAVALAQNALSDISFEGIYYRKDIGFEFYPVLR